jgi:protein-S-isoprenylcysteine O-methyltransferase Ste14
MKMDVKSWLLTIIQFFTLFILLTWTDWFADSTPLLAIQIAGFVIGVWAISEMAKSKLNVAPNPRPHSRLIKTGPYRIIRHPMYLSLLLFLIPMVIHNISYPLLLVFVIFIVNLILKMLYEEKLLIKYFRGYYESYIEKTWRLIPLIF